MRALGMFSVRQIIGRQIIAPLKELHANDAVLKMVLSLDYDSELWDACEIDYIIEEFRKLCPEFVKELRKGDSIAFIQGAKLAVIDAHPQ